MSALSDAAPIDQVADHGRRISMLENAVSEIRAEYRNLSESLREMHGENKANAETRERLTLDAIKECRNEIRDCRQDIQHTNSFRSLLTYTVTTAIIVMGFISAHFAGWMQ